MKDRDRLHRASQDCAVTVEAIFRRVRALGRLASPSRDGRGVRRHMGRFAFCFYLGLLICGVGALSDAQVTFERLVNSAKEPQNWMTYSGDYSGKRFSALDQINGANAHNLQAKWVYQTAGAGRIETTPLVVDGILYATAQDDRAFALDARTGRPI